MPLRHYVLHQKPDLGVSAKERIEQTIHTFRHQGHRMTIRGYGPKQSEELSVSTMVSSVNLGFCL